MLYVLVGQQSKKQQHSIKREWSKREVCVIGKKNIPLVSEQKVLLQISKIEATRLRVKQLEKKQQLEREEAALKQKRLEEEVALKQKTLEEKTSIKHKFEMLQASQQLEEAVLELQFLDEEKGQRRLHLVIG